MGPYETERGSRGGHINLSQPSLVLDAGISKDPLSSIAIVGMAIGFPQDVTSPGALWKTIMERRSTCTTVPKSRMNIKAMYHPDPDRRGQVSVQRGHFLEQDLAAFDAPFFSTSTTDAASMDPQQRLLLEYTYLALENAGIPMEQVAGSRTSVFTGSFCTDWQQLIYRDSEECGTTAATGVTTGLNANRISWFFDLLGTSANVDTACSSSLVCLDLGCQGLRSDVEDMSIVAGSNIILSPDSMHSLTNLNMLSPSGESLSFDHRASGYSRGEGIGVLILKRVADAIQNGDTIRGIIRSSGCNQDGKTPSVTLPNATSQAALIRRCYDQAGLSKEPVRFMEAHGTGTPVGDPTEVNGFGSVFRHSRTADDPLYVGAVKANLGHLEGASGIAGVIKTLLVLEQAVIPPNNNLEKLNGKIDVDFLCLKFPTEPEPWPVKGPRRASVNSFGNGGTNAHVVLDDVYHFLLQRGLSANHCTLPEPPAAATLANIQNGTHSDPVFTCMPCSKSDFQPRLLVFSAADEAGIARQVQNFASHFKSVDLSREGQQEYVDNVAHTLAHRRSRLSWRSCAVINSPDDIHRLEKVFLKPNPAISTPGIGFIFTGQGAQWAGMGKELMVIPVFRDTILGLQTHLDDYTTMNLCDEIFGTDDSRISEPAFAQTLCTAIQIALIELLQSFSISPLAVVGHSSGEIAAAYSIGAICGRSAMKIAYFRGMLASQLAQEKRCKGAMMSVNLSPLEVDPYITAAANMCKCPPAIVVACINSNHNVTISGDEEQIDSLAILLGAQGIFHQKLTVNVAYHSPHMQAIADSYQQQIGDLHRGTPPKRPVAMFSSVTGKPVVLEELCKGDYWMKNMISPVQFVAAVSGICDLRGHRATKKLDLSHRNLIPLDMFIELGPHSALRRPLRDILEDLPAASSMRYGSCLVRKTNAFTSVLDVVGQAHCMGYEVALDRVNSASADKSIPPLKTLPDLPGYSFDHSKRYWEESRISARYRNNDQARLDLLGKPVADWNALEPRWRNHLRSSEMSWIEDHIINGSLIYPGAGMLVMAIEAVVQNADQNRNIEGIEIRDVSFVRPLPIAQSSSGTETQISLQNQSGEKNSGHHEAWCDFRLFVFEQEAWHECCYGSIRPRYVKEVDSTFDITHEDGEHLLECLHKARDFAHICDRSLEPAILYGTLRTNGLELGPAFHRVQRGSFSNDGRIYVDLQLYKWPISEFPQPHVIHPTTLDAIFHVALAGYAEGGHRSIDTMVPTHLGRLFVRTSGLMSSDQAEVRECAWLKGETTRWTQYAGFVVDPCQSTLLAEFDDLRCTKIAQSNSAKIGDEEDHRMQSAYHINYLPDIRHLDTQQILSCCTRAANLPTLSGLLNLIAHRNLDIDILEVGSESSVWDGDLLRQLSNFTTNSEVAFPRYRSFQYLSHADSILDASKQRLKDLPDVEFVNASLWEYSNQAESLNRFDMVFAHQELFEQQGVPQQVVAMLKADGMLIVCRNECSHTSKAVATSMAVELPGFSSEQLEFQEYGSTFSLYRQDNSEANSKLSTLAPITVVYNAASAKQQEFYNSTSEFFRLQGFEVRSASLEEVSRTAQIGSIYISALEFGESLLYDISEHEFSLLQSFLLTAKDVIWVNDQGGSNVVPPKYCIINGIARVLQREHENLQITILALEKHEDLSQAQLASLDATVRDHLQTPRLRETEYVEIDGVLNVPRIIHSLPVSEAVHQRSLCRQSHTGPFESAPPIKLSMGTVGVLDTLHLVEDKHAGLADDEVELETKAIGLNYGDCSAALGSIPELSFGHECAGIVTRAGERSGFSSGDRVILSASDTFKKFACGKAALAMTLPEDMPFVTGAAIPVQFGTAWKAIYDLAGLRENESILIHCAAGGTGQAAIQVARMLSATIYATVGSDDKKRLLTEEYDIPEDHIFYSRNALFAQGVRRMTHGQGVNVVLNCLPGETLLASLQCVASYGRVVDISTDGMTEQIVGALSGLKKNITFMTLNYNEFLQDKPESVKDTLAAVLKGFSQGVFKVPSPLVIHDISNVKDAFRRLADGKESGKHVFEVNEKSPVEMILEQRPSFKFASDATYVIAGGLGGLGRTTARWMAERGARNLVLLSRSGPRAQSAFDLIAELEIRGVRVETPACDVTDMSRMQDVFGGLMKSLPPIRGCIQSSVIARDGFFASLTYDDWHSVVDCKTKGSWNLDALLPAGLDFFVLLASASGLSGIRGQTNYNAGNCFEDALARNRVSRGEKAVALDLGAMRDDGILASNPELLNRVLGYGSLEPIGRRTYCALLDYYCDPSLPLLSPLECQIGFGLGLGGGEGLESFSYERQPMMYPLQFLGERQTRYPRGSPQGTAAMQQQPDFRKEFAASGSIEAASKIVARAIVGKLSKSLSALTSLEAVDENQPLQAYGVDSLLAVELRNWISKTFDADVAVFETQGASTLGTLSFLVSRKSHANHANWTSSEESA